MVLITELEKALSDQKQRWQHSDRHSTSREFLSRFKPHPSHVEVISGVRRCGKSTLMRQLLRRHFASSVFFNFEDSRVFGFEAADFQKLDGLIRPYPKAVFFDEIQNIDKWEIYVRQLHEEGVKVFVTGSNASLLSRELGTRLTGRYLRHEVFPFSYTEFLSFRKIKDSKQALQEYLTHGGFPEYLMSGNPEVLQLLLKDIVLRDIAVRHQIRSTKTLMDITLFLVSNIGKECTFNSIRKHFGLGSANTASDFLYWLEDSYLLFFLPRFSYKTKNISVNPRKVYVVDNGLAVANSLSFSDDYGRLLENMVFLHLRKKYPHLYYFRENKECDFVVTDGKKCRLLVQACMEVNADNKKRETEGLLEAMDYFNMKEGFIITLWQKDILRSDGRIIHIMPLREFLLK
ncbi:MAG: ATP-binding protein [Bacteroidia bacterium]|nr:ATP-binding protein [Bacteroidia bacterium]